MKSKISEQISSETSEEDKGNVRKYANNIINKLEMKYYLINNKIMKGCKMPMIGINRPLLDKYYKSIEDDWLNSLQPCEITEDELNNIEIYLDCDLSNPIEVTDIIEAHQADGLFEVISFKQPTKSYKTNEAVEFKTWCDVLNNVQKIKSSFKGIVTEFNNEELYEIFKTQKK